MQFRIPFVDLKAMHAEAQQGIDAAWNAVTDTCDFIGGPHVEAFEAQWAAFCGSRYCVGTSDGTAALELALRALGAGPGDDILVPANTFVATWEAVVAVGARPVAVDVDPETLLAGVDDFAEAMTSNTVGIIPVHLFGQPVNMTEVVQFARGNGLWIVEDAAQAHGSTWNGQRAGSMGDIGCFSFYPGKNLGAFGDAGAIVTNSEFLADRIRSLANHGRAKGLADRHDIIGNNRRMDGLQAALLSAKLPFLVDWNARRRKAFTRYAELLADLPVSITRQMPQATSSCHLAVIQIDHRDAVKQALADIGIATGIHYRMPCHLQPAFQPLMHKPMPVAEKAAGRILSLPMFPHISEAQVQDVVAALAEQLLARAGGFSHAAE